ncbi:hypothetical protein Tco_0443321 [Tanacetum coccineum]
MTLEDAQAQLTEMKTLTELKSEKEKTEEKLKKLTPIINSSSGSEAAEFEAKRKKMLEEYNHYITFTADPLPIIKSATKLTENLKAKFEWINTQAKKLGIPPPPDLTVFGLFAAEKKQKRSSEILKEVFIKEDIVVDGMHRNLVPSPVVKGSRRLVIKESESEIFLYNGNFDLVFQREEEFQLATTAQLIRTQSAIQRGTPEVEEIFKKMELTIEARNDVTEARRIVKENLDVLGQNM